MRPRSKQSGAMKNKCSRVTVNDAGNEQQDPSIPASIADDSQGPSPKSSPVAEQLEFSEVSSPPALDPFTSVGTPGDLALLPSLVEVTHQIVYSNKNPPTTAPSPSSMHDRIVELFAGKRMASVTHAHRKTCSEEVPKRPELSAGRSEMTRNQPSSLMAQSFMVSNVYKGMEHGAGESVVLESFTPPNSLQDRQLVVRPNLKSRNDNIHQAQAHIPAPDPELDELEHDIFAIQRPVAKLSPIQPVERRSPPVGVALTRIPVPHQSTRPQACVREFSFRKRPVKPVFLEEAPASANGLYPGMPVGLHDGMPAYYEWLKEHGYVDENYAFHSAQRSAQRYVRLAVQRSMQFKPPVSVKPVNILPAPVHRLNGFAVVAKDEFKPQSVVRGFETPYLASHLDESKSRAKVETEKLFVVPLEYSREHNCAVQNHAALMMPPP